LNVPPDVKAAMFAGLAVIGVGLGAIYVSQRRGMFGWLAQHLVRMRIGRRFIEPRIEKLRKLDRIISEIHTGQPAKFAASVAFNALGWLGGAVELFVVLWLLGTPRSAGTAFVIETMSLIISAAIPRPVAGRDAESRQGAHLRPLRTFAHQRIRCRSYPASARYDLGRYWPALPGDLPRRRFPAGHLFEITTSFSLISKAVSPPSAGRRLDSRSTHSSPTLNDPAPLRP
jgi:hypothetical protein